MAAIETAAGLVVWIGGAATLAGLVNPVGLAAVLAVLFVANLVAEWLSENL